MQDFRNRLLMVTVILGLAFLVLGSRLWYLQVLKGEEFEKFSLENHIRVGKEGFCLFLVKLRVCRVKVWQFIVNVTM